MATIPVIKEIMVVEKQLGADVIGTGIDLGFHVIEFVDTIRSGGVAFREAGDADTEAAWIGVAAGVVEGFDVGDEVGGVAEIAL